MFVNLSAHPSAKWSADQLAKAVEWGGEVQDFPFPTIPPEWGLVDVLNLARQVVGEVCEAFGSAQTPTYKVHAPLRGQYVLVQGEASLQTALHVLLSRQGATVVVATSERKSVETVQEDGTTKKESVFEFVRFRLVPKY